jgi:hypothetical protein
VPFVALVRVTLVGAFTETDPSLPGVMVVVQLPGAKAPWKSVTTWAVAACAKKTDPRRIVLRWEEVRNLGSEFFGFIIGFIIRRKSNWLVFKTPSSSSPNLKKTSIFKIF